MSVASSDDRDGIIDHGIDQSRSTPGLKDRLVGTAFAILAGVATAGWLYLIAKVLWACIGWLAF
jgi:hypothetical protein